MPLSREQILGIDDIAIKEIEVPQWNDSVYIKQLSRGQQDEYLKRQFGRTKVKGKAENQEMEGMELFGHDAYACVCGICDESGNPIFKISDMKDLQKKNGEAIGFIAAEIIGFSGMGKDVEAVDKLKN